MEFEEVFAGVHLMIGAFVIVSLIILLIRRIRIKDEETFEKRDN